MEADERRLQSELLGAMARPALPDPQAPSVQAVFCIDVRSEVFRRALEAADATVATRGFAGFFGLPVDYRPEGPRDEWSGDRGVGSQYFSQQVLGRLVPAAGIDADPGLPLPEKLKLVQKLMAEGDPRARRIYSTVGVYLGYGLAHFASFYDCAHVLVLGRVMTGDGGNVILERAREVLRAEFPELSRRLEFHTPDETSKRHGQAVAAASLPAR